MFESLRLDFKHKNSIKRKRLWLWQIFMERHSKRKFHVLVKELKLFDHEFFFKHIAIRHFDFSQRCFTVFVLFNNLLHSAISFAGIMLSNNLLRFGVEFFSNVKREKHSSTRKRNSCVFSRCACAKLKTFLSTEKFRKEKIVNSYE